MSLLHAELFWFSDDALPESPDDSGDEDAEDEDEEEQDEDDEDDDDEVDDSGDGNDAIALPSDGDGMYPNSNCIYVHTNAIFRPYRSRYFW